jgi:hypothetical protein
MLIDHANTSAEVIFVCLWRSRRSVEIRSSRSSDSTAASHAQQPLHAPHSSLQQPHTATPRISAHTPNRGTHTRGEHTRAHTTSTHTQQHSHEVQRRSVATPISPTRSIVADDCMEVAHPLTPPLMRSVCLLVTVLTFLVVALACTSVWAADEKKSDAGPSTHSPHAHPGTLETNDATCARGSSASACIRYAAPQQHAHRVHPSIVFVPRSPAQSVR